MIKAKYSNLTALNIITALVVLVLPINLMLGELALQDNWALTQFLSSAFRVIHHGTFYPSVHNLYAESTTYFPGMSFLAYAAYWLSPAYAKIIFLVANLFLDLTALWLLYDLTVKMHVQRVIALPLVLFCSMILFSGFKGYMMSTRPDILCVLFGILAYYALLRIKSNHNSLLSYVAFIFCLVVGGLVKQQFVAIYIGMAIYTLVADFSVKFRIFLLSVLCFSGVVVLAILSLTDHAFTYSVLLMLGDPVNGFSRDMEVIANSVKVIYPYLIFLSIGLYSTIKNYKSNKEKSIYQNTWIIIVTPCVVLQALAAAKVGGNSSDINSALLSLVPYVGVGLSLTFNRSIYTKAGYYVGLCLVSFLLVGSTFKYYKLWKQADAERTASAAFLARTFPKNSKVLFSDRYYFLLKQASLSATTSLQSVSFYGNRVSVPEPAKKLIRRKYYNFMLLPKGTSQFKFISKYYMPYKSTREAIPVSLQGYLWVPAI